MGDVWTTQSFIKVNGVMQEYGILFAADVQSRFSVGIGDLGFNTVKKIIEIWIYADASFVGHKSCSSILTQNRL